MSILLLEPAIAKAALAHARTHTRTIVYGRKYRQSLEDYPSGYPLTKNCITWKKLNSSQGRAE